MTPQIIEVVCVPEVIWTAFWCGVASGSVLGAFIATVFRSVDK